MNENKLLKYKDNLNYSVNQKDNINNIVEDILEQKDIDNIILLGCGGSLEVMHPCKYIIELNSQMTVHKYNAGEFNLLKPNTLTGNSLVILSSVSGKTKQTLDSIEYIKKVGATTIAFVGDKNSPIGKASDYICEFNGEIGVSDSQLIMLYELIFSLLEQNNDYSNYNQVMNAISLLPEKLVDLKKSVRKKAKEFGERYKKAEFFMILASGPCWGEAYNFATCNLEEMQWIKTQPVHADEFFHGPFEIVRENTNLIIFMGEDKTRPLVKRAINFAQEYSQNVTIIDTKSYDLDNVSKYVKSYLSPLIISVVKNVYFQQLAEARDHSPSIRKYMGKVDY